MTCKSLKPQLTFKNDCALVGDMIQDLTWVNGHILALYTTKNTSLFLEMWVECKDKTHTFLMFEVGCYAFLDYLNHKTSLRYLIQNSYCNTFIVKHVEKEQENFYCIHHEDLPPEYLPPEVSFLPRNTTFLNKKTSSIFNKIIEELNEIIF